MRQWPCSAPSWLSFQLGRKKEKVQPPMDAFQLAWDTIIVPAKVDEVEPMNKKLLFAILIATTGLSACSTRLNPFNWFGRSEEVVVPAGEAREINPLIPTRETSLFRRPEAEYAGTPVLQIKEMAVERVPGGAIIRAEGVAKVQGAHDVVLKARNGGIPEKGVLTFDFLAVQHPRAPQGGPEATRLLTGAIQMTDQQLEGVRTIQVVGESNARQTRRR
ncbi:hypothetical protein NNA36_13655 [Shimia sp. CNT1-13L.2]|uniref:hypothetical protein n=1 Tax=Shimia sp. CNT1-13L.2 TaxID=2959663 RepID=UPI0020CEE9C5|nr:hypothetical protein [Shimia sp. CNT1-13L.2]MCP9483009.1 hypothetical protein [Shimia sp. CNT1-13L.2]